MCCMKMKSHILSLLFCAAAACGMAAESLSLDGSWSFRFEEGKPLRAGWSEKPFG